MMKLILAFLMLTVPAYAGLGIGVTPYPGPGIAGTAAAVTMEILTPTYMNSDWAKTGAASALVTVTDDDDGTYFSTAAASNAQQLQMSDVVNSALPITSVRLCIRTKVASTASDLRLRLHNGTDYASFFPDPKTITGTTMADVCTNNMAQNPYTESAWTASALNAFDWYVNTGGDSIGSTVTVSKIWAEVNY